jgi:O-antigen ligase
MLEQNIGKLYKSNSLLVHLIVACSIGLLLGVSCMRFSPLWTLIALVGCGLVLATLKKPEMALLGIIIITSSIIFERELPLISVGIGSLHISDIFLLGLLGLIAIRWLVEPDFKIIRTPLDKPLLIFYGVAMLSTFIAIFQSTVEIEEARRAIRQVTYYLTFFAVINLIKEEQQLRNLLRGFFLIATIVALVMIVQVFVGESEQLMPGYVGTLKVSGVEYPGTIRVVPPGKYLLLISFITLTVMLCVRKFKPISAFMFLQWILLGLAVLLTFLRSFWIAIGIALFILLVLSRGQVKRRFLGWGLMVIFIITLVLLIAFDSPDSQVAKLVTGSIARLSTLGRSETLNESSLQWRYIENEYALDQIQSHPVLGLGLGARYRPYDPRIDWSGMMWDARNFIHNGHLWILITTGLLGYFSFMWLSFSFLLRGFKNWRCILDSQMRGIALGFTLAYLGVVIIAIVNSIFLDWAWTPIIGIMMGVNEVSYKTELCIDNKHDNPCS